MLRRWLITLIREAIHAELSARLSEAEAKLSRSESKFADIAVRVKEKQEAAKPARARTWSELKERLEAEPKG